MTCNGCGAGTPRINNADPFPEKTDSGWRSGADADRAPPLGFPEGYNPAAPYAGAAHEAHPFTYRAGSKSTQLKDSNINSSSDLESILIELVELRVSSEDGQCQATSKGCAQSSPCSWTVIHTWLFTYNFRYETGFDEVDPGEAAVEALTAPPSVAQTSISGTGETQSNSTAVTAGKAFDGVNYEVVHTVVHEITVSVDCDSSGEQTLAYDTTGGNGGTYQFNIDSYDWTGVSVSGGDFGAFNATGIEEVTIQLPCLPCVVAGGGDPPAPGSSSSSSPFLRIREGD